MPISYRRYYTKAEFLDDLNRESGYLQQVETFNHLRERERELISKIKETNVNSNKKTEVEKRKDSQEGKVRKLEKRLSLERKRLYSLKKEADIGRERLRRENTAKRSRLWSLLGATQASILRTHSSIETLKSNLYETFARNKRKAIRSGKL